MLVHTFFYATDWFQDDRPSKEGSTDKEDSVRASRERSSEMSRENSASRSREQSRSSERRSSSAHSPIKDQLLPEKKEKKRSVHVSSKRHVINNN